MPVPPGSTSGGDQGPKPLSGDPWAEPDLPPSDFEILPWDDTTGQGKAQIQQKAANVNALASMAFVSPEALERRSRQRPTATGGDGWADEQRAAITPGVGAFGLQMPNISTAKGGGVVGDFADIFGQTSRLGRDGVSDEGLRDAEIPNREQTYSDLMRDQTQRLTTQINHYIKLDDSLYTSQGGGLAPLQRINATSITYDELIFDTQVIPPVAELAPTRFMGFRRKSYQHAFVRRGIGIRGTTDFMKSEGGRAIVVEQLLQILNSIHETLAFGVIYSILTCNHVQLQQVRRWRRFRDDAAMYELLTDEKSRWDILKFQGGIFKWNAICDRRLQERRGVANTILIAPDVTTYIALEHRMSIDASMSGEKIALGSRNDSVDAIRQWMNNNVVILRTYSVDNGPTQNPLQFRAQIGEYYRMTNSLHGRYDGDALFDPMATSAEIYDESENRWALIDAPQCIDKCMVFEPNRASDMRTGSTLQSRAHAAQGIPKDWEDVPSTFYDQMTGKCWPYLASLLYSSCHDNLALYRMFAQSMIQAMRKGTAGRVGGGVEEWNILAGQVATYDTAGGGGAGTANATTLGGIIDAGTITGLTQGSSTVLRLGTATGIESPVGIANAARNAKWFGATPSELNTGRPGVRKWAYSSAAGGGNPGLLDPAVTQNSTDITSVLTAIRNGGVPALANIVPHLAQVMLDTLGLSAIERIALRIFGALKFEADTLKALHAAGVVLPCSFVLFRPHAEYTTLSSVKMQAGLPTAATYVKDGLFEMGSDPVVGEVAGKFTFHSRTVIQKPENVCVMDNTFVNGYIGGMNARFIEVQATKDASYNPAGGQYGVTHMNTQDPNQYNQRARPSLYCFMVPYGWLHSPKVPNPISLHGALHVDLADNKTTIPVPGSSRYSFPGLGYYEDKFHFRQRIVPSPDIFSQLVINMVVATNAVAWEGHTRHWDPVKKSFGSENFTQVGTGHWGPKGTFIGCDEFRRGNFSKDDQKV